MTFILDTSTLGGLDAQTVETIVEDRGQGVTLDWQQSGNDQDFESYGFSLRFAPAEDIARDANLGAIGITGVAYGSGIYTAGLYSGSVGGFGPFILDISTLGSLVVNTAESIIEDRGRSIQVDWSQSGFDQDLELYGYAIRLDPAESHPVEVV